LQPAFLLLAAKAPAFEAYNANNCNGWMRSFGAWETKVSNQPEADMRRQPAALQRLRTLVDKL
jgi:hypothetical protein